jgi:hypothetical protein
VKQKQQRQAEEEHFTAAVVKQPPYMKATATTAYESALPER